MFPRLPDKSAINFWWKPPVAADRPAPPGPGGAAEPGAACARRSSFPAPRATSLPAAVPARRRGARSLARSPLALPSSLPPSSCLLPSHGCLTEPLNSHRSPPPLARRARGDSAAAGALGRADCRPPSNSPRHRFPALATHSHPPGASRPRDPLRQRRYGGDLDPQSRCRSRAREATHLCAPPYPPPALGRRAAVPASSFAGVAAVRPSRCAGAARAARLSESRGGAALAGVEPSSGSGRAGSSSHPALRPRPPGVPPPAPRLSAPSSAPGARAVRATARGAHWAKWPGCLRSPLPRVRPLPCAPSPPCHTCTCCGSTSSSAPRNFCFDSNCGGGRRCGGRPGPAEAAGGRQDPARGRSGGPGRATSRSGLRVLFLFFSLPPPGFKGTVPAEARGQAAAVSPVSRRPLRPGQTRPHPEHRLQTAGYF